LPLQREDSPRREEAFQFAGVDARDIVELKVIAADQEAPAPLSAAEEPVLKPKDSFKECA